MWVLCGFWVGFGWVLGVHLFAMSCGCQGCKKFNLPKPACLLMLSNYVLLSFHFFVAVNPENAADGLPYCHMAWIAWGGKVQFASTSLPAAVKLRLTFVSIFRVATHTKPTQSHPNPLKPTQNPPQTHSKPWQAWQTHFSLALGSIIIKPRGERAECHS